MRDLQSIADRVEIEALRGEFTDAMMHDYDRLASLFTPDRAVRMPYINAEAVGREDIRAGVDWAKACGHTTTAIGVPPMAGSSPSASTRSDTSTPPRWRARRFTQLSALAEGSMGECWRWLAADDDNHV
jgi:hypothetical protein